MQMYEFEHINIANTTINKINIIKKSLVNLLLYL